MSAVADAIRRKRQLEQGAASAGLLGGVEPPSAEEAAAGTMRDDASDQPAAQPPEMDLQQAAQVLEQPAPEPQQAPAWSPSPVAVAAQASRARAMSPPPLVEASPGQRPGAPAAPPEPLTPPPMVQADPPDPHVNDMYDAEEADRKSHLTAGMEMAARQLVGGITRTGVPEGIGAAKDRAPLVAEAAKSRRQMAIDALARKRQGVLDENTLENSKSERALKAAEAVRALREKAAKAGADSSELDSYKAVMAQRYPTKAKLINGLSTMKGAQDLQNSLDAELGRAQSQTNAQIMAGQKREEHLDDLDVTRTTKAVDDQAKQALPGYQHDPGVQVSPTEVSNLRTGHAESRVMSKLIDDLDGMVAKNGLKVWPDADKVRMQTLLKQLQLKAKGKAFAELGVLSGPDLAILEELTGDPTDVMTAFKGGAEGVRARLKVFKNVLNSGMEEARASHGYSDAKAPSGDVTTAKNGKKYRVVNGAWEEAD